MSFLFPAKIDLPSILTSIAVVFTAKMARPSFHQSRSSTELVCAGGAGIGLIICKAIVKAHCGQVEVGSMLNEGFTFKILLPLA
jgi:signal transduction histidine kinase